MICTRTIVSQATRLQRPHCYNTTAHTRINFMRWKQILQTETSLVSSPSQPSRQSRKFTTQGSNNTSNSTNSTTNSTRFQQMLQNFLGPKPMPPRWTLAWYREVTLICTVFAITGTSTMVLVSNTFVSFIFIFCLSCRCAQTLTFQTFYPFTWACRYAQQSHKDLV